MVQIRRGRPFELYGASMWPFLRSGDLICFTLPDGFPSPGEIVLFARRQGFTVHRVVAVDRAAGRVTTRGDSLPHTDPCLGTCEVLGQLAGRWEGGHVVPFSLLRRAWNEAVCTAIRLQPDARALRTVISVLRKMARCRASFRRGLFRLQ